MNILLVSHGSLCAGVYDAYHMLVPTATNISAVSLTDAGISDFRLRLDAAFDELLAQGDLLVLADLRGGTPFNESYARFLKDPTHLRLVSGLNLPMLIEAGLADGDLDSVYQTALDAGRFGVSGTDLPEEKGSDEDTDLF